MNRSGTLAIAAIVALVGMLAVPATAAAVTDLAVGVEQNPETGEAVVTVTSNGTAVENATVTVTSEAGYAGNGTYETDANGTVVLDAPEEAVSVTVNASSGDAAAGSQVDLVPLEDSLDVGAEQADDGSTTVTVTQYDDPVANASVEVKVDADADIAGNYTTDANATVTLDRPAEGVNATIVATTGELVAETTVELNGAPLDVVVDQREDGVLVAVTDGGTVVENATVTVDSNDDYAGEGTYETDAAGEVVLPLPSENVTVEMTATANNETATATTELTVDFVQADEPFGLAVSQFVDALRSSTADEPPGRVISEFVTGNNPGNADEAPGLFGDAANDADDDRSGADEAGSASDDAPGRSENADETPGNSGDAPGRSDGDDADDDETENDEGGPGAAGSAPDDAGPADDGDDDDESEGERDESEDEHDEGEDDENERDGDDGDEGEDERDESGDDEGERDESDESNDDDADDGDDDGGSGGPGNGGAPGNSGDAPGRN